MGHQPRERLLQMPLHRSMRLRRVVRFEHGAMFL
jgi:hypothetical protein